MGLLHCVFCILCAIAISQAEAAGKDFVLPLLVNKQDPAFHTAYRLAVEDINNNTNILPNTNLEIDFFYSLNVPEVLVKMLELVEGGHTLIGGNEFSGFVASTGVLGDVYQVAQYGSITISTAFSDKVKYPYFSRGITPADGEIDCLISTLEYFSNEKGPGWTDVAILVVSDEFGINLATSFLEQAKEKFNILTYQMFISSQENFDVELREIKESGARVILAFVVIAQWPRIIQDADALGLVGEDYVWVGSPDLVGAKFSEEVSVLSRGLLAPSQFVPQTEEYINFVDRWEQLDPEVYTGSGTKPITFTLLAYDAITFLALVIDELDRTGELERGKVSAELWSSTLRNTKHNGVTGYIELEPNGDRVADGSIAYYNENEKVWIDAFSLPKGEKLQRIADVVWFSNTTEIPDLDIREPFHYWSCDEKKLKFDETGKNIRRETPDGSGVDDIDSGYHCDNFVDCKNLSDETIDCAQNFTALFVVFGIICSVLIFLCFILFVFVIVFGIFFQYQRLRVSSPAFLIIILFSMIIGYFSVFAWFGKPHPVACAFQPWLLGLSSISMIAALCAKTFRIWRIFGRDSFKRQKITDLQMLGIWALFMIPSIFILILWTIISTPTASIKERNGEKHFVCSTGGFTGEPGGYIFFGIFVAYGALVLFAGSFLSIATRKVPSLFNESKLLAISIYNIGFLSVVTIPVFLVVQPFNPFIAWTLRTVAILYAFTATLILQFAPMVTTVVLFNRCKNVNAVTGVTSHTPIKVQSTTEESKP